MNAMTLLHAMQAIDPQDLEHALLAGLESGQTAHAEMPQQTETLSVLQGKSVPAESKWLRTGGIAAAAACIAVTAGVLLYVRGGDDGLMTAPSVSGQLAEITETASEQTVSAVSATSVSAASRQTTHSSEAAVFTGTPATTAETRETPPPDDTVVSQQTAPEQPAETVTAGTTSLPVMIRTETQTAPPLQTETKASPPAYAAEVPVLAAMGDGAGALGGRLPASDMQSITDPAAISAYLSGNAPVVTVGSGGKPAGTVDAIRQNPALLRIRWQPETSVWDSYGIQSAVLDGSGVLHLTVGMYSSGEPQPEPEWIYEASLLYEAGTMPPVQALDLSLNYYADTTGISQWLAYTASLDEDVYVQYRP